MKITSVGAELLHVNGRTDGRMNVRTDMTKLRVAFSHLATHA